MDYNILKMGVIAIESFEILKEIEELQDTLEKLGRSL